ncbi:hypothetical protein [Streptomyces sp. NPDC007205]
MEKDGHRLIMWRTEDTARLQRRTRPDGTVNDVTANTARRYSHV